MNHTEVCHHPPPFVTPLYDLKKVVAQTKVIKEEVMWSFLYLIVKTNNSPSLSMHCMLMTV